MRGGTALLVVLGCLVSVAVATDAGQQQATVQLPAQTPSPSPVPPPDPRWQLTYPHVSFGKYEDFALAGPDNAWLINAQGEVIHTADAGATWTVQHKIQGRLRSIDFVDDKRGYTGTLTGELFRTIDGGATWENITSTLGRQPGGFCGMTHVGKRFHTVGRYYGNVTDHYMSPDGGQTWRFQDLSEYAQALIEIVFLNEKVGFIGGMSRTGPVGGGPAIILQTKDAGETWRPVFTHDGGRGFAWKIFPVTDRIIYTALQSQDGIFRVAKSTDAGDSWTVQTVATGQPMGPGLQGIGFLDAKHGFVGGFFEGLWETTDGGEHWARLTIGNRDLVFNRFELFGKTLVTAARSGIWTYKHPQ
jgi:photosystem II stability/assembly factor-like uncharacterized protein